MSTGDNRRRIKCTGVLSAKELDAEENIKKLQLVDKRGVEYHVEDGPLWADLIDYVDEEMWVSGLVSTDPEGVRHLYVEDFRVFDEDAIGEPAYDVGRQRGRGSWDDDY